MMGRSHVAIAVPVRNEAERLPRLLNALARQAKAPPFSLFLFFDNCGDGSQALVEAHPAARVACLGLAFKANIDDFRESPARLVAATLARRFGSRISVVEPYAEKLPIEFTDTGAELIDLDTALEDCDLLVVLVDHDVFRVVPLAERAAKLVYDTRGIWPDQPRAIREEPALAHTTD